MQANTPDDSIDARVRRRLRQLRTEQGLTLQQVSERAYIDVSTLSRLEAGKRRLALDHIPALAAVLGVTADELLGDRTDPDPAGLQQAASSRWPDDVAAHQPRPSRWASRLQNSNQRATNKPPKTLPVHDGHDWMYVLDGRMRLVLGEQDLIIEPGEAVEFSTWTPHWFGAIDGAVELLALLGAHGEKVHLHE